MTKQKPMTITLEQSAKKTNVFDEFLISFDEQLLRIDWAQHKDEKDKTEVIVKQSVAIPADQMMMFCAQLIQALLDYEKTYKNGKGLSLPDFD